ncbi:cobalt ECF transporter T component CbiQ [Desulfobacter postgatei]|jgi:cobalt/nickel transport system permease protein|uniref:Cobalt ABC transporter, permease protein CbiQ n=1 Tax=Desulfobacter postgatei 2ac9 TaxID=879212 RepID=I5B2E4_9BACT|nr:cobalt ECF transporter T component CbiQ [Desulfobacter postgatei]EIM63657.1 cobalt ABC transporter, permease protein CbiQ [Desulfobacter postgatei 2ac9]MDX9962170.1 cobalt ECF transporter T component CbiQ [Desulfobacter postgatei]
MLSEAFAGGNSILHRLDPRLRIVFATLFSFLLAVSKSFPTMTAGLGLSMVMIGLSQIPLKEVLKRVVVINGFNLVLFVLLPITFEGTPLFLIGPMACSVQGLILAVQITLKSNAILLIFLSLVATMTIATLGNALNRIHIPEKIVYLMLLAYRYVFVLEQEYLRLVTAIKVRGFEPKTNLHTYRTYAYLFGMLLVRATARADRVYQSMLCRGFKGKFYCIHGFSFSGLDRIGLVVLTLILIVLGSMEWLNPMPFNVMSF